MQMAWLIFFMTRPRIIDVGRAVEREYSVALKPARLVNCNPTAIQFFLFLVARACAHWIDKPAATADDLQAGVQEPSP